MGRGDRRGWGACRPAFGRREEHVSDLVDFGELDSLLQCTAAADRGNIDHSVTELDECTPEGGKKKKKTTTVTKRELSLLDRHGTHQVTEISLWVKKKFFQK